MLLDDKLCNVHPRLPAMVVALSKTPTGGLWKKAGLVPDKACRGSGCLPHKLSIIPPNTWPFDFLRCRRRKLVVTSFSYSQTNKKQLTLFCGLEGTFPQQFHDQKCILQKRIKYRSKTLTAAHDKSRMWRRRHFNHNQTASFSEKHLSQLDIVISNS